MSHRETKRVRKSDRLTKKERLWKGRKTVLGSEFISSTLPMPDWFIRDTAVARDSESKYKLMRYQAIQLLKRTMRFVDGFVTSGMVKYEYNYDDPNPWIKIQIILKPPKEGVEFSEEPPG